MASSSPNDLLCLELDPAYRKPPPLRLAHLSVFSLIMIVSTPKNWTFSSGRLRNSFDNSHAWGKLCIRASAAWVLAITSGGFGWYSDIIS